MASLFGIAARPLDVMVSLFCAMDLLRPEREEDTYSLTGRAEAFLTHQSQWDLAPYFVSLKLRPQVREIVAVLMLRRRGYVSQTGKGGERHGQRGLVECNGRQRVRPPFHGRDERPR